MLVIQMNVSYKLDRRQLKTVGWYKSELNLWWLVCNRRIQIMYEMETLYLFSLFQYFYKKKKLTINNRKKETSCTWNLHILRCYLMREKICNTIDLHWKVLCTYDSFCSCWGLQSDSSAVSMPDVDDGSCWIVCCTFSLTVFTLAVSRKGCF